MRLDEFFTISDLETIRDSLVDYMVSLKLGFCPSSKNVVMYVGDEIDKCSSLIEKIDKLLHSKEL